MEIIHSLTGFKPWIPFFWVTMISIVICLLPLWASPDEKTVFTKLRRRTVYFYMILPLPLFLMGAFLPSWLGTDGQFDGLLYPLAMPMATFFWAPLGAY